ncbi:unnamed protein product [Ectocarpus fasciculatus]
MKKVEGQKEVWRDKVHELVVFGLFMHRRQTRDTRLLGMYVLYVYIRRCGACEVESNKTLLFYGSHVVRDSHRLEKVARQKLTTVSPPPVVTLMVSEIRGSGCVFRSGTTVQQRQTAVATGLTGGWGHMSKI